MIFPWILHEMFGVGHNFQAFCKHTNHMQEEAGNFMQTLQKC